MPIVLIVEDNAAVQNLAHALLGAKAMVLRAETQQDALAAFGRNLDVKVIIMDGYVPGPHGEETISLIETMRHAGYAHWIILFVPGVAALVANHAHIYPLHPKDPLFWVAAAGILSEAVLAKLLWSTHKFRILTVRAMRWIGPQKHH